MIKCLVVSMMFQKINKTKTFNIKEKICLNSSIHVVLPLLVVISMQSKKCILTTVFIIKLTMHTY